MTKTIHIPTSLRRFTRGQGEVPVQGHTVAEVIDELEALYEGVRENILDEQGIRRYVNIYIGQDDIRFLNGLDTNLESGDTVTILMAIAGG